MITGMPSGRVLVLSLAFGMYTRRTGAGLHELRVACTCIATSARAWLVNATSPSTPAVPRPLLRCVTCRTLTNVFDQLRSMSFCRSLTLARSPVPNRLEDPAPQPPYPLLAASPVHPFPGVTVEHRARVLGSVHRSVQLIPQLQHPRPRSLQRPTCPRQHP